MLRTTSDTAAIYRGQGVTNHVVRHNGNSIGISVDILISNHHRINMPFLNSFDIVTGLSSPLSEIYFFSVVGRLPSTSELDFAFVARDIGWRRETRCLLVGGRLEHRNWWDSSQSRLALAFIPRIRLAPLLVLRFQHAYVCFILVPLSRSIESSFLLLYQCLQGFSLAALRTSTVNARGGPVDRLLWPVGRRWCAFPHFSNSLIFHHHFSLWIIVKHALVVHLEDPNGHLLMTLRLLVVNARISAIEPMILVFTLCVQLIFLRDYPDLATCRIVASHAILRANFWIEAWNSALDWILSSSGWVLPLSHCLVINASIPFPDLQLVVIWI
jgi:hypothetical protein